MLKSDKTLDVLLESFYGTKKVCIFYSMFKLMRKPSLISVNVYFCPGIMRMSNI